MFFFFDVKKPTKKCLLWYSMVFWYVYLIIDLLNYYSMFFLMFRNFGSIRLYEFSLLHSCKLYHPTREFWELTRHDVSYRPEFITEKQLQDKWTRPRCTNFSHERVYRERRGRSWEYFYLSSGHVLELVNWCGGLGATNV